MRKINIAIDGPAGSGKGTVARLISEKLGYIHIDSGIIYRLLTLLAIRNNMDVHNEDVINELLKLDNDVQVYPSKVVYNGEDVTNAIRSKEVNELVSIVAGNSEVRKKVVKLLQAVAKDKGIDASFDKRVERRYNEEVKKGMVTTIEEVRNLIASRDYKDMVINKVLVKDDSYEVVDTTDTTVEEAVNKVLELAKERINND